jgi:hypothetical protein
MCYCIQSIILFQTTDQDNFKEPEAAKDMANESYLVSDLGTDCADCAHGSKLKEPTKPLTTKKKKAPAEICIQWLSHII